MAELHKIHLRHFGFDEDSLDRVQVIEDAIREVGDRRARHAEALADSRAEKVAAQRERIKELESLGVGRAVKFAVGQRIRSRRAVGDEGKRP